MSGHAISFADLSFRVVFPFVSRALNNKLDERIHRITCSGLQAWQECDRMPEHYHDNHVTFVRERFLSGQGGSVRYFQLHPLLHSAVPSHLVVGLGSRDNESHEARIRFCAGTVDCKDSGIELFLSDFGVGLASFAFRLDQGVIEEPDSLELLSRIHLGSAWGARSALLEPCGQAHSESPLFPANGIRLFELAEKLLPLDQLAIISHQRSFNLFVCARIASGDQENDFGTTENRNKIARTLANMQNLWRSDHAGIDGEAMLKNHSVFNRRHWSAVSRACAAHLVADQSAKEGPVAVEFNNRRVDRINAKFFFPYILSQLQHLALQNITNQTILWAQARDRESLKASDNPKPFSAKDDAELRRIRDRVSRMPLSLLLDEVSNEDNPQAFYQLCRETLEIPQAVTRLHQAIDILDRQLASDQLAQVGQTGTEHLDKVASIQENLEWIEIFVVSVYAVELAHVLGSAIGMDVLHGASGFKGWFEPIGLLSVALFSGGAVLLTTRLNPPAQNDPRTKHKSVAKRGFMLLLILAAIIGLYLLFGLMAAGSMGNSLPQKPADTKPASSTTSEIDGNANH